MPFCQNSVLLSRYINGHANLSVCVKIAINMNINGDKVLVTTTARLHMGFFDLNGSAGRMFGSLGASIDAPCTQIEISKSEKTLIDANCRENMAKIVENIAKSLKIEENFSLKILQSIPEHAGLGSGTQMALAIGAGLNTLFELSLTIPQIAMHAQRGSRSGIGIAAFEQGGALVDNGRAEADGVPKLIAREIFPETWSVLLVQDSAHVGVHGAAEAQVFTRLQPAQHQLRDLVMLYMLPALQRADLLVFGACMADLQAYNGDYFAPIQGGRYASQDVASVLHYLQQNGVACVGQSSWGPTGFAILENEAKASRLRTNVQQAFAGKSNLSFNVCRGNNHGARIERK